MSILINKDTRVIVQGITGREGRTRASLMRNYGTNVVAGVTPGKSSETVEGIPVFDTVEEAWEHCGPIEASGIFVPAPLVKDAALEAMDAGVKLVVIVPDRVPLYDIITIDEYAKEKGAKFIGPNTVGVLAPDEAVIGMLGGRAETAREWFTPGPVGVISRSGGLTSAISYYLTKNGIGQSGVVHVGGESIVGLPQPRILELFEQDPQTKAVVMYGEIGGSQEELCAELMGKGMFTKPLITYIGGAAAKPGTRFSHAGAIVEGEKGSYQGKVERLKSAGAHVVERFDELFAVTKQVLGD